MSVSIKKHFKFEGTQQEIELKRVFTAALADITALKAASAAFTAKLDTDATAQNAAVASSQLDTDYAATIDALQTSNLAS